MQFLLLHQKDREQSVFFSVLAGLRGFVTPFCKDLRPIKLVKGRKGVSACYFGQGTSPGTIIEDIMLLTKLDYLF